MHCMQDRGRKEKIFYGFGSELSVERYAMELKTGDLQNFMHTKEAYASGAYIGRSYFPFETPKENFQMN